MKLETSHYVTITAIAVVIAGLFFFLKGRRTVSRNQTQARQSKSEQVDATPDAPVGFGYKCIWLAVKTTNSEQVVKEIGLQSPQKCNWQSGIRAAYNDWVFVSPPVNGWTLVIGNGMATMDGDEGRPKAETLMNTLSATFGEAQHFATHRVSEYHAWARSIAGNMEREFVYSADFEKPMVDLGKMTPGEMAAGLSDNQDFHPNESTVMKVAEAWSVDPTQLSEKSAEKNSGWLGKTSK